MWEGVYRTLKHGLKLLNPADRLLNRAMSRYRLVVWLGTRRLTEGVMTRILVYLYGSSSLS